MEKLAAMDLPTVPRTQLSGAEQDNRACGKFRLSFQIAIFRQRLEAIFFSEKKNYFICSVGDCYMHIRKLVWVDVLNLNMRTAALPGSLNMTYVD